MNQEIMTIVFACWLLSSPIAVYGAALILHVPHECDGGPTCKRNSIMALVGGAVFWVIVLFTVLYIFA